MKTLFKTCNGSHIWLMNLPESDIDVFKCYIAPSEDFFIGKSHRMGHHSQIENIDITSIEIGQVVTQLLKNNLNYLVNVLSPIAIITGKEHEELKKLTMLNLSKLSYNSIYGMTFGNYVKYIENCKSDTQKRRRTVMRTLKFGITLLQEGKIEFKPVLHDVCNDEILDNLKELKNAYENSILPEKPEHSDEMYEWLLNLRINNLRINNLKINNLKYSIL